MTVQELIEQLEGYPKDMTVRICGDTFDSVFEQDVDYTDYTDTNKNIVAIYGKEE